MTEYTAVSKNTTTHNTVSKSLTESFLLLESGSLLLLEVGDKIILEQSVPAPTPHTSPSKNSTSYSTIAKN